MTNMNLWLQSEFAQVYMREMDIGNNTRKLQYQLPYGLIKSSCSVCDFVERMRT